ncbi:MAG: SRPBCC domain-containing protein [Sporichthyaceae bacterium]
MTDLGTILRDGDRVGLHFRRVLRHPPERVWRALNEAEDLRQWFPCDIVGERAAGGALTMPFWPGIIEKYDLDEDPVLPGELLVWDPPKVFEFRWDTEILRWELTPHQDGTELLLTTWLVPTPDAPPAESAAAGYHVCLDALAGVLNANVPPEPSSAFMEALQVRYRLVLAGATR